MKLFTRIDCFNKADVCFAVAAKETYIFITRQMSEEEEEENRGHVRRREERIRGVWRESSEESGQSQNRDCVLAYKKRRGSECSLSKAVMGAGKPLDCRHRTTAKY